MKIFLFGERNVAEDEIICTCYNGHIFRLFTGTFYDNTVTNSLKILLTLVNKDFFG